MNTSKSLDDILDAAIAEARRVDPWKGDFRGIRNSAKAAIVEAVEGLIGPDEKPWVRRTAYENSLEPKAVGRNELRAELRQAIKEWQRGAIVTTVQDDLRQCLRELARLGYPAVALEKKYKVNITEDEI